MLYRQYCFCVNFAFIRNTLTSSLFVFSLLLSRIEKWFYPSDMIDFPTIHNLSGLGDYG